MAGNSPSDCHRGNNSPAVSRTGLAVASANCRAGACGAGDTAPGDEVPAQGAITAAWPF